MAAIIVAITSALISGSGSSLASGHALKADGPPAFGTLGFPDAKVGKVYRFAFPLLVNSSGATVRVNSFELESVPSVS
jgi:hypothetical protein